MKTLRLALIGVLVFATRAWAITSPPPPPTLHPDFASMTQIALDASVPAGVIYTEHPELDVTREIRRQLKYSLGQLSWWDGAPQITWFKIQTIKSESVPVEEPNVNLKGLTKVTYTASGRISWSKKQDLIPEFELIMPARGDDAGIHSFTEHYFKNCQDDEGASEETLFYYYFPLQERCPLLHPDPTDEKGFVVRFPMQLVISHSNTTDKYPEYGEIWKDHRLTYTAVFGKQFPGETLESKDWGIRDYNDFYAMLVKNYGVPRSLNDHFADRPGASHPDLRMTWRLQDGRVLDLHMYLVDALATVDTAFAAKYSERTKVSDVISYNGHAGYGSNVERLGELGTFTPGKYQIFLVNGCGTYSYLDDTLYRAHGAVNPGFLPSKHLDVISNTVSAYFNWMPSENIYLIDALFDKKLNYLQILNRYDARQRVVIDGEEDNRWPNQF